MKALIIATLLALVSLPALADTDVGVSSQETYAKLGQGEAKLLFIDVRDPVEIMFVGFTDAVDINIPYLLVDRTTWDDERGSYKVAQNPRFIEEVRAALKERGLSTDAEIITMCRSGSERGKPSADFLRANGFPNAR